MTKRSTLTTKNATMSAGEDKSAVATATAVKVLKKKQIIPNVPMALKNLAGTYFYVRNCYDEYYNIILSNLLEKKERCVTMIGTPVIGKAIFYVYCYDHLKEDFPQAWILATVFEDFKFYRAKLYWYRRETNLYSYSQYETIVQEAGEAGKKLFCLCDGPPEVTQDQMVVFTSPNERWTRISSNFICSYYMPLWTLKELEEAARVLNIPLDRTVIAQRFSMFSEHHTTG